MTDIAQTKGHAAMLMYALITALSSMLIHNTTQTIAPLLSAFYTFLICVLVYNGFSIIKNKRIVQVKKSEFTVFMLNLTTSICWLFTFFCLKYISAELYLFVYLCSMTITSAFFYRTHLKKAVALSAGLILLICTYKDKMLLQGVTLAFLGGASGMVYSIYSKKVVSVFTTLDILSLRFYLILFLTFGLAYYFGDLKVMDVNFYWQFVLLALVSIILPLTLFQIGIKNLSVTKALSFLPLAPLSCYFFNGLLGHLSFNPLQLVAVIFLSIAMFF